MTEPTTFHPKTLGEISAVFHNGTLEAAQAITDWVTPLLPQDWSTYIGLANRVFLQGGSGSFAISSQDFVYHDDDGFHVVPKGPFELVYGPSGGV